MLIPKLELVSDYLCPYVQRAVILLLEKNIPHQVTYIDLSHQPDWFSQISPLGKVPLLKVGNQVLFESTVICEYLDEITPGSLHPPDPLKKAKHRAWIEFGSNILSAIGGFFNAATAESFEQKRQELIEKFTWVERSLETPYFMGERFSLIDAVYAPIFSYIAAFDAIADFGILAATPKVRAWQQALKQRPSIQKAFVEDYSQQLLTRLGERDSYLSKLAQPSRPIAASSQSNYQPRAASGMAKHSSQTLREYINYPIRCTTILAVLGAALNAELTGTPADPIQVQIDEVLDAVGMNGQIASLSTAELKQLLAEIRFNLLLSTKFLLQPTDFLSWTHDQTETKILQAVGEVSAGFADALTQKILPSLDGLSQRLAAPGGAFLDIGVGTAGLSIAMAQLWPSLKIVGIDPSAASLACAKENLQNARLTDRILLREQAVEQLSDIDTFDLAWLPSAFISEQAITAACEAVYRALHPGGWLLFAMANPGTDPVTASLARLRTVFWGGSLMAPSQVEALLGKVGFEDIRALASPPNALVALVAARRMW